MLKHVLIVIFVFGFAAKAYGYGGRLSEYGGLQKALHPISISLADEDCQFNKSLACVVANPHPKRRR